MQKALLVRAFVFAYGSAALARELALPHMASPGTLSGRELRTLPAVPRHHFLTTSDGSTKPSIANC
jgi:hypothetical protein